MKVRQKGSRLFPCLIFFVFTSTSYAQLMWCHLCLVELCNIPQSTILSISFQLSLSLCPHGSTKQNGGSGLLARTSKNWDVDRQRERERKSSFSLTIFHNKTLWHVCLLLKMLEVAVAFVDGGGCWVGVSFFLKISWCVWV